MEVFIVHCFVTNKRTEFDVTRRHILRILFFILLNEGNLATFTPADVALAQFLLTATVSANRHLSRSLRWHGETRSQSRTAKRCVRLPPLRLEKPTEETDLQKAKNEVPAVRTVPEPVRVVEQQKHVPEPLRLNSQESQDADDEQRHHVRQVALSFMEASAAVSFQVKAPPPSFPTIFSPTENKTMEFPEPVKEPESEKIAPPRAKVSANSTCDV